MKKQPKKKSCLHGGLSGSSTDESQSEDSDKDAESDDSFKSVSSADDDDFNPFRDESDEDEEDGEGLQSVTCSPTVWLFKPSRSSATSIIAHSFLSFCSDPWIIRKEPKKGKEKKKSKKKKKKSIDPDSIQSALLASGLGSSRPTFSAPAVLPSMKHAAGKSTIKVWGGGVKYIVCKIYALLSCFGGKHC